MILVVADLAVCGIVVYYLVWGRKRHESSTDSARLGELIDSLATLIKDSDQASKGLLEALRERHRRTEALISEMDDREKRLSEVIQEAEGLSARSHEVDRVGAYQEVARLADMGLTRDEIEGKVKLPKGEIQLILELRK
jgi:hypothetical protein